MARNHETTRTDESGDDDNPHDDPEWLRKQYVDERLSVREIADLAGCGSSTVHRRLREFDIERRDYRESQRVKQPGCEIFHRNGYLRVRSRCPGGERPSAGVHQLVAIADGADPHKVFSGKRGGYSVHHENRCRWDNSHDNLTLLSTERHGERSAADQHGYPAVGGLGEGGEGVEADSSGAEA